MLEYRIKAQSQAGGDAFAEANHSIIRFDASDGRMGHLPNPAELLLSSMAACMLKNVARFSRILHFEYSRAEVEIVGVRNDAPPFMSEIHYVLKIRSDMERRKLDLLHKNILKFGTITNTLAKAAHIKGEIAFL